MHIIHYYICIFSNKTFYNIQLLLSQKNSKKKKENTFFIMEYIVCLTYLEHATKLETPLKYNIILSTVIWGGLKVVHPIRVTTLQPNQLRIQCHRNKYAFSNQWTGSVLYRHTGCIQRCDGHPSPDGVVVGPGRVFFARDRTF